MTPLPRRQDAGPAKTPGRADRTAADRGWRALHRAASAPYRPAGRFAWHFARGKLGRDPVFRALVERGLLPAGGHVLDLGCGQGLVASLLAAATDLAGTGHWPATWAAAPCRCGYTGVELMPRDVARARAALGGLPGAPRFVCADLRQAALPSCEAVLLLDVMHYVDHAAQDRLLRRVRRALTPRGRLLMRVGDAAGGGRYAASQWIDHAVARLRGHRAAPVFGRRLDDWRALVRTAGFTVEAVPMSRGTPFANMLLVAEAA